MINTPKVPSDSMLIKSFFFHPESVFVIFGDFRFSIFDEIIPTNTPIRGVSRNRFFGKKISSKSVFFKKSASSDEFYSEKSGSYEFFEKNF